MMSKDKYPNILSCQWRILFLVSFKYFFATRAVLKIQEYHSDIPQDIPQFQQGNIQGIFSHVTKICDGL